MQRWALVARLYGRRSRPVNTSLNWTMPAFVNRRVGSLYGTREELGTIEWPFRSKYARKRLRASRESIIGSSVWLAVFEDELLILGVDRLGDAPQPFEAAELLLG